MGFIEAFNRAGLIREETVIDANTAQRVGEGMQLMLGAMGGQNISFQGGAVLTVPMTVGAILIASDSPTANSVGGNISGNTLNGIAMVRTLVCYLLDPDTGTYINVTSLGSGRTIRAGTVAVVYSITGTEIRCTLVGLSKDSISRVDSLAAARELTRGSGSGSKNLVNFTNYTTVGNKTYSRALQNCPRNMDRLRLYIKFNVWIAADSNVEDIVQCVIQRNANALDPDFDAGGSWSTIHTRTFRLLGGGQAKYIDVDHVDTAAIQGDNYYRLVCTNLAGGLSQYSTDWNYTIFCVPVF